MDLICENPKTLYRRYLLPSMASALVTSIYAFVDTIAVGQYAGGTGAAAVAVTLPLFGIFSFLSILCSVGGCVCMAKAEGEREPVQRNRYFTASFALLMLCTLVVWGLLLALDEPILRLFGTDAALMPTAKAYAKWIIWFAPAFFLPTALSAYLRNDGAPRLAMAAVIVGGGVNIFGDWFFVFPMDMGVSGAGLATMAGSVIQTLIMGSHFLTRRSSLRLVRLKGARPLYQRVLSVGLGASVIEFATIFITILMNNQIMRYGTAADLAVYGVIATIAALFQSAFRGIGQAAQPILSANYGAHRHRRIIAVWNMALRTGLILGVCFAALGWLFPTEIMRIFIAVDDAILAAAPHIVRLYFPLFVFQSINILAIYYLQSILASYQALTVALLRSALLSGVLLLLLPLVMQMDGVWSAQLIAEALTAALSLGLVYRGRRALDLSARRESAAQ